VPSDKLVAEHAVIGSKNKQPQVEKSAKQIEAVFLTSAKRKRDSAQHQEQRAAIN